MIQTQITPKHWLDAPAASSYARMRAAGCPDGITEAGRTFEQQTAMFAAFLAGRLAATAAVPGTSKHEKGNALDLPEPARAWVRENGLAFGWIKDRVAREPWHMEYQLARDKHLTDAPLETLPEDDMYTDADRLRDQEIHAMLAAGDALKIIAENADLSIPADTRDIRAALSKNLPEIKAVLASIREDTNDVRLALSNTLPVLMGAAARDGMDPAVITAAVVAGIPASIAQDVLDGLTQRLKT